MPLTVEKSLNNRSQTCACKQTRLYLNYRTNKLLLRLPKEDSNLKEARFLIPLGEINEATKNFSEKTHIWSGYNMVYKGQLFDRWHNRTTAIKRYTLNGLEAKNMFHNELMLIYSFHHENIVPFIGYCDESSEMIIVSEYAINGM